MASAVDSRLAYARLSAVVATASRLPTANRGSNNSYTTSWDTTGRGRRFAFFVPAPGPELARLYSLSIFRAAMNASWGISTLPKVRMRFFPFFCLSSSLRLRVMSPP